MPPSCQFFLSFLSNFWCVFFRFCSFFFAYLDLFGYLSFWYLLFNRFSGFFSRFFYLTMVLFECASLTLFTSILIRFYLFVWYLESFLIELKQNCLICFTESLSFSLHNHQCYQSGLHVLSTESWADFASIHKFPFSNYLYFEFVLLFFFCSISVLSLSPRLRNALWSFFILIVR